MTHKTSPMHASSRRSVPGQPSNTPAPSSDKDKRRVIEITPSDEDYGYLVIEPNKPRTPERVIDPERRRNGHHATDRRHLTIFLPKAHPATQTGRVAAARFASRSNSASPSESPEVRRNRE